MSFFLNRNYLTIEATFDNILLINLSISLINVKHTIKRTYMQIFHELELLLCCFSLTEIW